MEEIFKKVVEGIRLDDKEVERATIRGVKEPLRCYVVYQLELSDGMKYIGSSVYLYRRISTHKKKGMDIENYTLLHHTDCKDEVIQAERFYIDLTWDYNINLQHWDVTDKKLIYRLEAREVAKKDNGYKAISSKILDIDYKIAELQIKKSRLEEVYCIRKEMEK